MCGIDFNILEKLCLAVGISGDEGRVRDIIMQEVESFADEIKITPLGDLIVFKKGKKSSDKRLMISAHMDEVGLIINDITDDGYLRFLTVGGIDSNVLLGKTVFVNQNVKGVIGGKPVHLMSSDEKEKAVPISDLTVDIGASSREEAESMCAIGDYINFTPYYECSRGTIKAKALDDRVGCAVLIALIKSEMQYDTWFAFTTREEAGCVGATAAAYEIAPDLAIAVEGTVAGDVMGNKSPKACTKMGEGPAISIIDRGTVYDRSFFKLAFESAKQLGISCQARTSSAGANDASVMHKARRGARAAAISTPCRYIHSAVSMASVDDVDSVVKLVRTLAAKMIESNS